MLRQLIKEVTVYVNTKLTGVLLTMAFMGCLMSWVYDECNPAGWTIIMQAIVGFIIVILNIINNLLSFKERYDSNNQKKTK